MNTLSIFVRNKYLQINLISYFMKSDYVNMRNKISTVSYQLKINRKLKQA